MVRFSSLCGYMKFLTKYLNIQANIIMQKEQFDFPQWQEYSSVKSKVCTCNSVAMNLKFLHHVVSVEEKEKKQNVCIKLNDFYLFGVIIKYILHFLYFFNIFFASILLLLGNHVVVSLYTLCFNKKKNKSNWTESRHKLMETRLDTSVLYIYFFFIIWFFLLHLHAMLVRVCRTRRHSNLQLN